MGGESSPNDTKMSSTPPSDVSTEDWDFTTDTESDSDDTKDDPTETLRPHSGLYTDIQYPPHLSTTEFFPFDSMEDALLYCWDVSGEARTPASTSKFDALLKLLYDRKLPFDTSKVSRRGAQGFRAYYDARLPLLSKHYCTTTKAKRYAQKSGRRRRQKHKANDDENEEKSHRQTPPAIEVKRTQVKVPFFSIDEQAMRLLADPLWGDALLFGDDYDPAQAVTQFNQTPLHHNILKWAKTMMMEIPGNGEVCVGDFFEIDGEGDEWEGHIYQIERFICQPGNINYEDESSENWWPHLNVQVSSFLKDHNQVFKLDNSLDIVNVNCLRGKAIHVWGGISPSGSHRQRLRHYTRIGAPMRDRWTVRSAPTASRSRSSNSRPS